MATQRQIEANRRNAQKSTGPRSRLGKRRVSRNAYRHGLSSVSPFDANDLEEIEELARQIAGGSQNLIIMEYARAAAHAEFQLARVRHAKRALFERMKIFGAFTTPVGPRLDARGAMRMMKAYLVTETFPLPPDNELTLPPSGPARSAAALTRMLPELLALDRYESRACTSRDRAIKGMQKARSRL